MQNDTPTPEGPSLLVYLACLVYESVLLSAWLLLLAGAYLVVDIPLHPHDQGWHLASDAERLGQQIWYLLGWAGYFVFFWGKNGQTLAMKTWRIRLVSLDGGKINMLQALIRWLCASLGISLLGITYLWAFGSKQKLFLHDHLSKTRLIRTSA